LPFPGFSIPPNIDFHDDEFETRLKHLKNKHPPLWEGVLSRSIKRMTLRQIFRKKIAPDMLKLKDQSDHGDHNTDCCFGIQFIRD
jgi:hypothetical protein